LIILLTQKMSKKKGAKGGDLGGMNNNKGGYSPLP
jgi:hypothetical protein